ncbi:MAG: D-glutamate deacylase [Bryobacterales bacterium]|nr:D-glutamate deacylase [Bryobacterales bacterium]
MKLLLAVLAGSGLFAQDYDTVILGGRVIDPESKLDAVRNVGITGGTIRDVSEKPLRGRTTINAKGLVVSPGFIDLHRHGQDEEAYRYQAMDGVTTGFELEVGTDDVDRWYAAREGKAAVNHGVSIGHVPVRMAVMKDPGTFLPSGDAAKRAATDEEITEFKRRMERGLQRGAVAAGFGVAYTAAASRWEILEMFRVAARFGASCHVHMRSAAGGGSPEEGLQEVIAAAAVTGAPLHVVHINSSALKLTTRLLGMIGEARERGMDVSTECYPYTAGATRLETALFDSWTNRPAADYAMIQWAATGERLTAETFARYRKTGGRIIVHTNTEEMVEAAVKHPLTMIASDGGAFQDGTGHPRSAGCYSRILGVYVREKKLIPLDEAIRKMTLMPALRLERRVPAMKNKGRIRAGADADITVFDAASIRDHSTYERAAAYSEGVRLVLVSGVPVVRDGRLTGATPGRGVRAAIQ